MQFKFKILMVMHLPKLDLRIIFKQINIWGAFYNEIIV